ncbi:hypothetical protein [uncultured Paraglaciecola sp.]|uniref:hypothetical protein n=1 Tax=uncultured Paraglaciecola sp. TaxID=1765024 RepID=UPI00262174CA|nr:hypothetical protein [uncultured Paraglaciecola sp.]
MSTETFKAKHIETRDNSVKVEHLGKTVFLPRSQIERMSVVGDRVDLTIPYWLFKAKFED